VLEVRPIVTQDTPELGIGDLAARTGVPVRTIRFYCDEGLLEAHRSAGGHRRFPRSAVDRLDLVRRLRRLGLGLPAIASVLSAERSLPEAVAAERAALDVELAALAWRRAALRAVEEASPAERAARLDLLAAAHDRTAAHDALVAFWQRIMAVRLPGHVESMFFEASAPRPPAEPTPAQVVAYAELVALVAEPGLGRRLAARAWANGRRIADETTLLAGIGEACELARPLVLAGSSPVACAAVDRFVAAYAEVMRGADTPRFRRELLAATAVDRDPLLRRYWTLIGEVTGDPAPVGTAQAWLLDALERQAAPTGRARTAS
jgi:excisionase family DNA binding protein